MYNEDTKKNASAISQLKQAGTTAERPLTDLWQGRPFFDTTLGQPIWYDLANTEWIDSVGTGV